MLKETGTVLGESARIHADLLVESVMSYPVDKRGLSTFLKSSFGTSEGTNPPHDGTPTELVDMKLDEGMAAGLTRELQLMHEIEVAISAAVGGGAYSALSTQFENSILFAPTAMAFYRQNEHVVRERFPDVETVAVNAFIVGPNERPYGVHNAGSLGIEFPELALNGIGYPARHVSFHTALTATPLDRQPLVIFEDAPAETPSLTFLYHTIRSFDLTADEVDKVERCYYLLISNQMREVDIPTARNFLICKYWEKAYGSCRGFYCDAKPGQAVFFDNYRPHGDSTLPLWSGERLTIDLRCFSRVQSPSEDTDAGRLFHAFRRGNMRDKRRAQDCFLGIFGYQDCDDFLRTLFGDQHSEVDMLDVLYDPQFVCNRTKHYVLDQDLSAHYERCQKLFETVESDGEYRPPQRLLDGVAALRAN